MSKLVNYPYNQTIPGIKCCPDILILFVYFVFYININLLLLWITIIRPILGSNGPATSAVDKGADTVPDDILPPAPWRTKLSHLNPNLNNILGIKVCDAFRTRSNTSCPAGDQCKKVCYKTASCPRYQPSAPLFGQLFAPNNS